MITCSIPLAMASSTPYWIVGLSTSGSISFGCALVTGKKRVPRGRQAARLRHSQAGDRPRDLLGDERRAGPRGTARKRPQQGARQEGARTEGRDRQSGPEEACATSGRQTALQKTAKTGVKTPMFFPHPARGFAAGAAPIPEWGRVGPGCPLVTTHGRRWTHGLGRDEPGPKTALVTDSK